RSTKVSRLNFGNWIELQVEGMFKRLSKSRRHSADDVALSLSSPTTLDEPPGTSMPRDNCQSISPAALLRVSRTKYTRRSCGDASAMQALLASKQEQEQDVAEADYQMVTAVPAFIVEHEPEKQREKILVPSLSLRNENGCESSKDCNYPDQSFPLCKRLVILLSSFFTSMSVARLPSSATVIIDYGKLPITR
ncbi:unnamed protein product, partial [Heterotrigona itama]